ncbi:uncharacterized protein LOC127846946 [Dreissena polymorpha]|uniref:B box-type domain-containing protein n=1 Tax=Dreissena polymorpha TaxID=45954 RepID=A0A9D4I7A6_DREPO|nr:uncharacterized protein LOC127846946 [Dreissena polymorpha]KAH3749292.1 hypothetical protein DPMN_183788 [Dreissena polymorpha]
MATSVSVNDSSDFVKDYSCVACESKNIEISADYFCKTCLKCFCQTCLYYHDQMFVKHLTYGRGESNKWPLTKTTKDLLLKCDVHKSKTLQMFCEDHRHLCCSDCLLLHHKQCTNVALISELVKNLSADILPLSNKIQIILAELNKFKRSQDASIHFVEGSYSEKLKEIREVRTKFNSYLDGLENSTLQELDKIRATLQTSLKQDVDNCSRLKDELKQLKEAVQSLCDKSKKVIEYIANRKCMDKILECESYLKDNSGKLQSSIIFQANIDIDQYLTKQSSLGKILTLKMNPNQVLTVKRKSEYNVKISSDTSQTCSIHGICSLPNGHVIVTDNNNNTVKLMDQHYNVSGHCDVADRPHDICPITSSEVAVTLGFASVVQFISVSNGQLVNGRKLRLPHFVMGIAHHQGALYITSGDALFHYTLTGALVKKLYEDLSDGNRVSNCAVSPTGDRIYVTYPAQHKLLTLARDGTLLSTFTDPKLNAPSGLRVTPSGQVIVCGCFSHTVIQVDREGKQKLATIASQKEGVSFPESVCYNTNSHQIIVGMFDNNKIIVMKLK